MLRPLDSGMSFDEADGVEQALRLAHAHPDVVLLDLPLRGGDGLDALHRLRSAFDEVPIIVLWPDDVPAIADRARATGASEIVSKRSSPQALRHAVRRALHHTEPVAADDGDGSREDDTHDGAGAHDEPGGRTARAGRHGAHMVSTLSSRQREVLMRAVQGKSNKAIARELSLSEGTVKAHLSAAYRVLGVNNRVKALLAVAAGASPSR